MKKNKVSNGLLRVSISRGCGSMGYLPKENIKSLLVIETINEKRVTSKNIKLGISDIKLPRKEKDFLEIKTAQSLNYVLAKIAAHKKGNFDDVILSEDNFVSECSSSNIFWVKNNKLYSPTLDCYCLAGTIRKKIIENFDVNLVKAKISDLKNADEIFITNTNILVLAVDEFESKKLAKNFIKKILDFIENDVKNYVKKKTSKHI